MIMNKARSAKPKPRIDGLQREYHFNYVKARPNRFSARYKPGSRVITLDPDVAKTFTTPESVNALLRALLVAMPKKSSKR